MKFDNCVEDCIHLRACRRIQKIGRSSGQSFSRYCNSNCSAYQSGATKELCSTKHAAMIARRYYDGSYDPYDKYESEDFEEFTLKELLDELYERR